MLKNTVSIWRATVAAAATGSSNELCRNVIKCQTKSTRIVSVIQYVEFENSQVLNGFVTHIYYCDTIDFQYTFNRAVLQLQKKPKPYSA